MEPEVNGMEWSEAMMGLRDGLERLMGAAAALEQQASAMGAGAVEKITAAVDSEECLEAQSTARELAMERRLLQMEQAIAGLQAASAASLAASAAGGTEMRAAARKTLPAATVQLLAKQGIDLSDRSHGLDATDVQSVDAALAGLSVEQRIAVKSQLLRTGALTL